MHLPLNFISPSFVGDVGGLIRAWVVAGVYIIMTDSYTTCVLKLFPFLSINCSINILCSINLNVAGYNSCIKSFGSSDWIFRFFNIFSQIKIINEVKSVFFAYRPTMFQTMFAGSRSLFGPYPLFDKILVYSYKYFP